LEVGGIPVDLGGELGDPGALHELAMVLLAPVLSQLPVLGALPHVGDLTGGQHAQRGECEGDGAGDVIPLCSLCWLVSPLPRGELEAGQIERGGVQGVKRLAAVLPRAPETFLCGLRRHRLGPEQAMSELACARNRCQPQ